jgi:NTP pyrophosphatase (non-canonical NTP hydrolase)
LDKVDKFSDEKLGDELADVILTTVRLARLLNIDMDKILKQKIEILRERFEKEN